MLPASLRARETGHIPRRLTCKAISSARQQSLALSQFAAIDLTTISESGAISGNSDAVLSLDVDGDEGRFVVCGSADASVRVIDVGKIRSGECGRRRLSDESGLTVKGNREKSATDPSGSGAPSSGADMVSLTPILHFRKAPRIEAVQKQGVGDGNAEYNGHYFAVSCVQWYPVDAGMFFSGSFDGTVAVWDANAESVALRFRFENTQNVEWREAEQHLADISRGYKRSYSSIHSDNWNAHTWGRTHARQMRDSLTDARSHAASQRRQAARSGVVAVAGNCDKVYSLHCSPRVGAHQLLAVGTSAQRVQLCDLRTGRPSHSLTGHRDSVWAVKWSPRSEFVLATGSADRTVRFWDVRRAGCLMVLDQHQDTVVDSAGSVKQHDAGSAMGVTSHNGAVSGIAFTPDGTRLLSTGTDNRMRSWWVDTGLCEQTHFSDTRNASTFSKQLAVSNDGKIVFHPSRSAVVPYEITTGQKLDPPLRGHHARVNCAAFNPLYEELYSGSDDCQVLLWVPERDNVQWNRMRKASAGVSPIGGEASEDEPDSSVDEWDAGFAVI